MSITQTLIEERLSLTVPSHRHIPQKVNKAPLPNMLIRSSSFTRLRQFPSCLHAYLCRYGSVAIFQWLTASQSKLSQLLPQLHSFLFLLTVYGAVSLIWTQLVMCIIAILSTSLPSGMAFLMTCILAMAALAIKLNFPQRTSRRSRSRTRTKDE